MNNFTDHLNFGSNLNDIMHVRKKLVEAYVRTPEQIRATAKSEGEKAATDMAAAVYRAMPDVPPEESKRYAYAGGMLAGQRRFNQIGSRADIRQEQIVAALNMIPEASYFGDHDAVRSLTRVLGDIHGIQHGLGQTTAEDLRLFSAVHSGDYQPMRPEPPAEESAPDPDDFEEPRELDAEDVRLMRRLSGQAPRLRGPEGGISRYYQ